MKQSIPSLLGTGMVCTSTIHSAKYIAKTHKYARLLVEFRCTFENQLLNNGIIFLPNCYSLDFGNGKMTQMHYTYERLFTQPFNPQFIFANIMLFKIRAIILNSLDILLQYVPAICPQVWDEFSRKKNLI